jgi:hypothetical protein
MGVERQTETYGERQAEGDRDRRKRTEIDDDK